MAPTPEFIEHMQGSRPDQFVARVRELLAAPRSFLMVLRFTARPDSTPRRKLLIQVVLDPKKPTVPILLLNELGESHRSEPRKQDALTALEHAIRDHGGVTMPVPTHTPPPLAAPEIEQPVRRPRTRVGETLSLF